MLGITMPVYLRQQPLLDLTVAAVSRMRCTAIPAKLYVVTTCLHLCTPEELQSMLASRCELPVEVMHEPGVSLSVAAAWNRGAAKASYDGAEMLGVCANDVLLESDTIDKLVEYGKRNPADLWSGIDTRDKPEINADLVTDGPDFSCFLFRPSTIEKFGYFDERFRPAYFEDNDFYVRVIQGGGTAVNVHAAKFYHHGSQTSKLDPDAAHHVRHWFGINRLRFAQKWGVDNPPPSADAVRVQCFKTPWNIPDASIAFCDR